MVGGFMTTLCGTALTSLTVLISFQSHKQCLPKENINSIVCLSSCGLWMKPHRAEENLPWSVFPLLSRVVSTEVFHCRSNTVELWKALQRLPQQSSPALWISGTLPPYVQNDRQSSPLCLDCPLIRDQGVGKILWSKSWHCSGFWRVMVLVGKKCFLKI